MKDNLVGQFLARSMVHSVADIALPQTEDLADQVVLEELHACKNVEHR